MCGCIDSASLQQIIAPFYTLGHSFSYPPHSSIVSGVSSPNQISSVHKRAPLWFALVFPSLGPGSHSRRMCLSPFQCWIPLVCWKHKSKRTVCLPRECVCANYIAQHSAALRKITASANSQSLLTAFSCMPSSSHNSCYGFSNHSYKIILEKNAAWHQPSHQRVYLYFSRGLKVPAQLTSGHWKL